MTNKFKKIFLLCSFVSVLLSCGVSMVYATTTAPVTNLDAFIKGDTVDKITGQSDITPGYTQSTTENTPAKMVGIVLSTIYGFLGVIALGLIVYAGINWMLAMGETEKIKKSVDIIKSTIIGLIILFSAYLITAFIISAIAG